MKQIGFFHKAIKIVLVLILTTVCRETAIAQKNDALLFDGLNLIGQSSQKVDEILGKAIKSEKRQITDEALKQPGRHIYNEVRHYKIEGQNFVNYTQYGVTVRLLEGKVIGFDVDLPKPQRTPQEALSRVGINVKDKREFSALSSETAKFWRDNFSGNYLTVAATKYLRERGLYDLVEVRLVQTALPDLPGVRAKAGKLSEPAEWIEYISKDGGFKIRFPKSVKATQSDDFLKEKNGEFPTKTGKLPIQSAELDAGSTLYAVSWLELPKEHQTPEAERTLSQLGFAHFKISNKSVFDDKGKEVGKWYLHKGCTNFLGDNFICISERIYANHQTLYRLAVWRNNINKNSSLEINGFEQLSERFFDGFQISAKQ